ncbi:MAG: chitin synthase [Flavobacteriales bacterium]
MDVIVSKEPSKEKHLNCMLQDGYSIFPLDRECYVKQLSRLVATHNKVSFVITLYNEDGEFLHKTLSSIARNIAAYCESLGDQKKPSFNVVIVVDGVAKISDTCQHVLNNFGLFLMDLDDLDHDALMYTRKLSPSILEGPSDIAKNSLVDAEVNFSVLVKKINAGKLDSHWWYYRVFCELYIPEYVFQLDAGSVVTDNALRSMVEIFDTQPDVGGLASSIRPEKSPKLHSPLEVWQFGQFMKSVLLEWPSEIASGYLSVIPGQFSALRWNAIRSTPDDGGTDRPLDVYFKGLGDLTPYESALYLAEDRVLCREIVTDHTESWRLDMAEDSIAYTDACESWGELLRQRKRWCNGYLACRSSFITTSRKLLTGDARSGAGKLKIFGASVYHSLQLLLDWFIPCFYLGAAFGLSLGVWESSYLTSNLSGLYATFFSVFIFSLIAQVYIAAQGELTSLRKVVLGGAAFFQSLYIVFSASLLVISEVDMIIPFMLVLFLVLSLPLAAITRERESLWSLLVLSIPFTLSRPSVAFMLWLYAIVNFHDSSWGTKGLAMPESTVNDSQQGAAVNTTKSVFLGFRNVLASLWGVSNACLFFGLVVGDIKYDVPVYTSILSILTMNAVLSIVVPSLLVLLQKKRRYKSL